VELGRSGFGQHDQNQSSNYRDPTHIVPSGGNVVYHGLEGHHFVRGISHVLEVRIIVDTEKRVSDERPQYNAN
jgi:hypothetical protein